MKLNQKQFLSNLVECARETYIRCYNLAINGDFAKNEDALNKLDNKVFGSYYKYQKKPKKVFKILIYTSGLIYNHEMIVDPMLCYDLNILLAIHKFRLYKAHKFIQFVEANEHIKYIVQGVKYSQLNNLVNNILRGVKC